MPPEYSGLEAMQEWADTVMASRPPDQLIGKHYLERWHIIPRNVVQNIYLHRFSGGDDDRALHDHPWWSRSFLLHGTYVEVTPEGEFTRTAGDVVFRDAEAQHRIILPDNTTCISLFFTGPKEREWGFACPDGWKHWEEFLGVVDGVEAPDGGPGCGEP